MSDNIQSNIFSEADENNKETEHVSIENNQNVFTPDIKKLSNAAKSMSAIENDLPMSDATPNYSQSNEGQIMKENNKKTENVSIENYQNVITADAKNSNSALENVNAVQCDVTMSNATPNYSRSNEGQIMEENDNVKSEEVRTDTASGINEISERNQSKDGLEIGSVTESILIDIQNNFLSDSSLRTTEERQILLNTTLTIKKFIHVIFTKLQNLYLKLLEQKEKLLLVRKEVLATLTDVANEVQINDLTDDVEKIIERTLCTFLQYQECYLICKSLFEPLLQKVDESLMHQDSPRTDLERQSAYLFTLNYISSKKFHFELIVRAYEVLENLIKKSMEISARNSQTKIDLHLAAIHEAEYVFCNFKTLQNILEELFVCIENCL